MTVIKIGDSVIGKYGSGRIKKIEICEKPGMKEGISVDRVWTNLLDRVVVDLDDGHFEYGNDLDYIPY